MKILSKDLVDKMTIYVYGGPTYNSDNIDPWEINTVKSDHIKYLNGLPKKWAFKPFYFSEQDFNE